MPALFGLCMRAKKGDSMSPFELADEPQRDVLINWLHQVLEIERQIYVIDAVVEYGNDLVRHLEKDIEINQVTPVLEEPKKLSAGDDAANAFSATLLFTYLIGYAIWTVSMFIDGGILMGIGFGLILGVVWPALVFAMCFYPSQYEDLFFLVMLAILLLGILASIVVFLVGDSRIEKAKKEEQKRVLGANEKARDEAHSINAKRKAEAEEKMAIQRQRASQIREELKKLVSRRDELATRRNELYGARYLHPVYQGLAPVAAILYFFETGRCTQLNGPDGAVDELEEMAYRNKIVDGVSSMDQNLGQMRGELSFLTDMVTECMEKIEELEKRAFGEQ